MSLVTISLLATLAALVSAALILGVQIYFGRLRRKRFETLELVPNILMTRFPLLFVGRSRSLFRLGGDFLEMPIYLQEHGYQVEEIEMKNDRDNLATLVRVLDTSERPVHLIVADAFSEAAYDLALDGHPKLATLTLIGRLTEGPVGSSVGGFGPRDRRLDLRPSRRPVFEKPELRPSLLANSFVVEEIALEHMVSLAEHDLR